jgi:serine/threonine protein kinase
MSESRKDHEKEPHFPDQKAIHIHYEKIKRSPNTRLSEKYYSYICLEKDKKSICYIHKNIPEAEGASGKIYKAWLISPNGKDYKLELRAMKVVDNFKKSDDYIIKAMQFLQEAVALRIVYPETELPVQLDQQMLILTRFISGNDLIDHKGALHPDILKMSLDQRFNLIISIAESIQALHQKGWMHGDVSGRNIKFIIDKNGITAYLVDFGLAQEINASLSSASLYHSPGTPGYLSPERIVGVEPSLKSDILSLTPLFALILGATNPLKEKMQVRKGLFEVLESQDLKNDKNFVSDVSQNKENKIMENLQRINEAEMLVPYTYSGILNGSSYFGNAITAFLDMMQDRYEENRPNILTVISFFQKAKEFDRIHSSWFRSGLFGYNPSSLLSIIEKSKNDNSFIHLLKKISKK